MIDDFLLVTTDLSQANKFLQIMHTGMAFDSTDMYHPANDVREMQASLTTDAILRLKSHFQVLYRPSTPTKRISAPINVS